MYPYKDLEDMRRHAKTSILNLIFISALQQYANEVVLLCS